MSDDADLEELKAQAQKSSRISAQTERGNGNLTGVLADALKAVENEDVHPNVPVRDAHTTALLHVLENNLEAVYDIVDSLRGYPGGNADGEVDKNVPIRLFLRVGLHAGASGARESLANIIVEYVSSEI